MGEVSESEFHELRKEVTLLRKDVKDLVDAWRTAQGIVRVVRLVGGVAKWLAGVVAACAALWAMVKWGFGK